MNEYTAIALVPVQFHGQTLVTTQHNGEPHIAMRPIVEAIGLNWKAQYDRIQRPSCDNRRYFCACSFYGGLCEAPSRVAGFRRPVVPTSYSPPPSSWNMVLAVSKFSTENRYVY